MTPGRGFLRDNVFLVAAVSLPLVVVFFFLLATAIPRWTVLPPAYDLVLSASDYYTQTNRRVMVDFGVRDGKVESTFRFSPAGSFGQQPALFLFDHETMIVREITVELPDKFSEGDPPRTVVVDALAGRQVLPRLTAPDGYQLENRNQRGPGIVGELFGMHQYNSEATLVNKGRVVPVELPGRFHSAYVTGVNPVAWLVPVKIDGSR